MFFDSNVWNFGLSYKTYPFLFVPEVIPDLVGVVVLQVYPDIFGVKNHSDFAVTNLCLFSILIFNSIFFCEFYRQ